VVPRRNLNLPREVKEAQFRQAGPSEEIRGIHDSGSPVSANNQLDILVLTTIVAGGQRRNDGGKDTAIVGHQADLSYGVLPDATPNRVLEGFVEEDTRVTFSPVQHQVEGSGSGTVMAFPPVLQSVSPETPKFWGSRRDFEPVVANEEEIVRALL